MEVYYPQTGVHYCHLEGLLKQIAGTHMLISALVGGGEARGDVCPRDAGPVVQ